MLKAPSPGGSGGVFVGLRVRVFGIYRAAAQAIDRDAGLRHYAEGWAGWLRWSDCRSLSVAAIWRRTALAHFFEHVTMRIGSNGLWQQ